MYKSISYSVVFVLRLLARRSSMLAILLFCYWSTVHGQNAQFEFFTTSDGLAGNLTTSVIQDEQGLIWFLSDHKIHRFDGRNFSVLPNPPLFNTETSIKWLSVYQDSLLFAVSSYKAYTYNIHTKTWRLFIPEKEFGKTFRFTFLHRTKQGVPLLRSLGEDDAPVLWRFSDGSFERIKIKKEDFPEKKFYFFTQDKFGAIYVANRFVFYEIDSKGVIRKTIPLETCKACYVSDIKMNDNNEPVLISGGRFYILKAGETVFSPHPLNRFLSPGVNDFSSFIHGENGSIWACGINRSLIHYDAVKDTLFDYHETLRNKIPLICDFSEIFKDSTGVVWVGTQLGLLKVRLKTVLFDNYFSGQHDVCKGFCSFRGFTEDASGMIYASFYNGIFKFDPEGRNSPAVFQDDFVLPYDLQTGDDFLWHNSGQQFDFRLKKRKSIRGTSNYAGDCGLFAKDKNERLWWLNISDLNYLDKEEGKYCWKNERQLPFDPRLIGGEAFTSGNSGEQLWIGMKNVLYRYNIITKKMHDFILPVERVMSIYENDKGKLWLGTDAGLVYFDPVQETVEKKYTIKRGLPDNFICGILSEGDSCLWLGTNNGLSRFSINNESFINFFEEDGLTHNEFNRVSYFKAKNGRMFFGGLRGINSFFPKKVMETYHNKNQAAKMVLSSFEYIDERRDTFIKEYQFTQHPVMELYHWTRSFTFEYALTDYNKPEEIYYSYKMDGYENVWSEPSKFNFTRFSNLPSGNYIFRVKARDSRGLWHPQRLEIPVVVHAPWWRTWWAFLAYILLFLVIALATLYVLRKRTILKHQLQLEQQEAMRLKELDAFKSNLYTNIAHGFRTPLTVILGMVGEIKNDPKTYLEEGVGLIEKNGENLLELINQLLDLSRLENNAFELELEEGDMVAYLRYVTESFRSFANSKNLSLHFESNITSLVMSYDPKQVKQILTNLISNAIKFTGSGGYVAVRISRSGEWLKLTVKDNGIGMSVEDVGHVFDRFYQGNNLGGEVYSTGIGLAHTQELVKIMRGNITVESELGKGATFIVRLPVGESELLEKKLPSVKTERSELNLDQQIVGVKESKRLDPEALLARVLIIEDNADVVFYLKTCLGEMYQIDVAYNGRIGIEKARENIPDLIISDVMMPEKNGYEVCEALKDDERTSHIPVILLTAKADVSSRITGLRKGADAYLAKPFEKEELLVRLEKLLERQKRMQAYFSANNDLGNSNIKSLKVVSAKTFEVESAFIQKVRKIIGEHYTEEDFGLPQLCQKVGISRSQLFRKMKALTGIPPSEYIRSFRLEKAKFLLETTDLTVSEVAWETGYKDLAHFSKSFQRKFGFSPSETYK